MGHGLDECVSKFSDGVIKCSAAAGGGGIIQTTRLVWAMKTAIYCLLFHWLLQSSVDVPAVSIIFKIWQLLKIYFFI